MVGLQAPGRRPGSAQDIRPIHRGDRGQQLQAPPARADPGPVSSAARRWPHRHGHPPIQHLQVAIAATACGNGPPRRSGQQRRNGRGQNPDRSITGKTARRTCDRLNDGATAVTGLYFGSQCRHRRRPAALERQTMPTGQGSARQQTPHPLHGAPHAGLGGCQGFEWRSSTAVDGHVPVRKAAMVRLRCGQTMDADPRRSDPASCSRCRRLAPTICT
jgi:hypothetical protein